MASVSAVEGRCRFRGQIDDAREAVDLGETHVERLDGRRDLGQRLGATRWSERRGRHEREGEA